MFFWTEKKLGVSKVSRKLGSEGNENCMLEKADKEDFQYDAQELNELITQVVELSSEKLVEQSKATTETTLNKISLDILMLWIIQKKFFNKLFLIMRTSFAEDSINSDIGDKLNQIKPSLKKFQFDWSMVFSLAL